VVRQRRDDAVPLPIAHRLETGRDMATYGRLVVEKETHRSSTQGRHSYCGDVCNARV